MESPFRDRTQRESQRELTRRVLFDAALEEFRREGFDASSIARIASRAGVSRPSFYFHFPTKEHVLLELQWNVELRIVERLRDCATLRDALHEFVEGLVESEEMVGSPELHRDVIRIYTRRPEGLSLEDQPFPVLFDLGRRFALGARDGELRPGLEPAQATHLFLTSVFGYLIARSQPLASLRGDLEVLISLYLSDPR
ncbi:MAG: TetR/AcrR family transcriptional regulator [Myxococcota bacterium]